MRILPRWLARARRDRDLLKELRFHIDEHADTLIQGGVPREEAERQARLDLGGISQTKERIFDSHPVAWVDHIACDLRDAWRAIRRAPGTALTAASLVALVIGGNATLFSMIHGLLTKPARAVRSAGLVTLEPRMAGRVGFGYSYPDYLDYVSQAGVLKHVLACDFATFTLTVPDGTYAFRGTKVTPNYFDTLGVTLVKGRSFSDDEASSAASGLTAIVSYRVWQEQLRGVEDVIGKTVAINGRPATIVGVAPSGFQGPTLVELAQIWVPLVAWARIDSSDSTLNDRASATLFLIGQLDRGVSIRQAQTAITGIDARLATAYPQTNRDRTTRIVPYSMTAGGNSLIAERSSVFLAVCYVITALTVLLVCANVANLMIARAAARERETALRRALGAPAAAIGRSLLFEGVMISLFACVAAFALAAWSSHAIVRLFPPATNQPIPFDFSPDWRVAAYALFVALVATIVFSMPPVFRAWRQNLLPLLKVGEQGIVQGRTKLSNVLVVVQITFAVLLLACAGFAQRSISLIATRDLGFDHSRLLLATITTTGASANSDATLALLSRIQGRLRGVPNIRAVSYARLVPSMPDRLWPDRTVALQGASGSQRAWVNNVGPEFLDVLGIRPIAGSEFSGRSAHSASVAMINRELADALWPQQSAIGRTLLLGNDRQNVTVVAVVPNALFSGYGNREHPAYVLLPYMDSEASSGQVNLYIRYQGSLDLVASEVRRTIREVDERVPIVYLRLLDTELSAATWPIRFINVLLTLFAGGALLIAAAGEYAVIAFDVRRRTRELGVRMALGATSRTIVVSVIRQGAIWSVAGLTFGLLSSVLVGRALRSVLFGITPTDVPTFLGVLVILLSASLLACYIPARRASRIDPMIALRQD
jgi:predicted permease